MFYTFIIEAFNSIIQAFHGATVVLWNMLHEVMPSRQSRAIIFFPLVLITLFGSFSPHGVLIFSFIFKFKEEIILKTFEMKTFQLMREKNVK